MGTLGEIVKPTFITVAPEDTLGEVAERMSAQNVGAVVVKDFGRLIGILTERDMLRAMAARVHTSDARVRQWMTEDPITAPLGHDVRGGVEDHARQGLPAPSRRRRRDHPRDRQPPPHHGRQAPLVREDPLTRRLLRSRVQLHLDATSGAAETTPLVSALAAAETLIGRAS